VDDLLISHLGTIDPLTVNNTTDKSFCMTFKERGEKKGTNLIYAMIHGD
jgi:hypothetical protein